VVIPIFLAGDNSYAPYIGTCIFSLLANTRPHKYAFYLLTPADFSGEHKRSLLRIPQLYKNCTLHFVNMRNAFKHMKLNIEHVTYPTYYRLLIADMFPELDKCLYLDADLIVCQDIAALYAVNLDNYYAAAVKAPYVYLDKGGAAFLRSIGLAGEQHYFNAGVLLLNLKNIRRDRLTNRFKELAARNLPTQDQDILNIACRGKVKPLDFKYNCMTKYFNCRPQLAKIFGREMIDEAYSAPVIIHYCDKEKPWQYPLTAWFWDYARQSPFYTEILTDNLRLPDQPDVSAGTALFARIKKLWRGK
jgi:lipopolysaccharide biosynthesis glycosyltransferase